MINGTLIAQVIHFSIAYQICKHIILKPVLLVIEQEEQRGLSLNRNIVIVRNQILAHNERKEELWKECLQKISIIRPSSFVIMENKSVDESSAYNELQVSTQQKQQMICNLTKTITKAVSYNEVNHYD